MDVMCPSMDVMCPSISWLGTDVFDYQPADPHRKELCSPEGWCHATHVI